MRIGDRVAGPVRVIDADTWDVGDTRVRLHAIDAPEAGQTCAERDGRVWPCGDWATTQATRLYEGRRARCTARDTDRYGRVIVTCTMRGRDVAEEMVAAGIALAFARFGPDYVLAEKTAAVAGLGIHRGAFQRPDAWRAARRVAASSAAAPPGCPIKGNISADGTRIYHMPGQAFYARTRISVAAGERWFCTETDARAAGWRAARR